MISKATLELNACIEAFQFARTNKQANCDDECLHHDFTDEEWNEECDNNDQSYWTQWY